ncbi:MAG: hypothetical protein IJY08_01955 [Clostridia bacterium]|nr:hypothetical protein [Clostridia bacterium]MBQ9112322.1 hypothetical protein [Clostridia bacterium]
MTYTDSKYIVVQNTYLNGNASSVRYGLALVEEEDGELTVLESVSDLSPMLERVRELADMCNTLQLDPIHLNEITQDFLNV